MSNCTYFGGIDLAKINLVSTSLTATAKSFSEDPLLALNCRLL
ncbi:hypothetical protein [Vibrio nigripulchritudo]